MTIKKIDIKQLKMLINEKIVILTKRYQEKLDNYE
jgi:hypothetical protein